ncbi:MAG: FprA family A-type flavoprotein [Armatimonadetes bacterium]|nr:FprA family A-type flavoprotein [Armatimonadota bacterium]
MNALQAVPLTDSVYWVGAIDWTIRDFHGYLTSRGTTYNAYLIMADKITLVDTVKAPFFGEMMGRIASVVDPSRIEVVVSNHTEMDHSGALPQTLAAVQPEKLYASKMGARGLARHFTLPMEITPVADGETLSLGNLSLQFMETKLLHWPDSMFSYLPERELLFSQDAFGMHLASSQRFDDEVDDWVLDHEATKYYANILTPFSPLVTKLLAQVQEMNLPLKMIAPDHGPIWRKDWQRIVGQYAHWAQMVPTRKAVIVYDTMWGSTCMMAKAYAEGLMAGGACVHQLPLSGSHRSDVGTQVLEAGALLIGSPTINGNLFPTVADTLAYLRGLNRLNLIGTAFGSYGWSGEATKQVAQGMEEMHVEMVAEPFRVQWVPTAEDLEQCFATGRQIAEEMTKRADECGCEVH